jgi:hypothetical protein
MSAFDYEIVMDLMELCLLVSYTVEIRIVTITAIAGVQMTDVPVVICPSFPYRSP